jgi:cation diffusion facilitator family transporter
MPDGIQNVDYGRKKQQVLAAKVSIWGSVMLFFISASVGIAVDSIALLLDASASLVVLFVAFLINFSIKRVHRPPDEAYNFGYNKYEPFTVTMQGVLIITTCVISIKFAIQDIIHAEDIHTYGLPAAATFISGIIGIFIVNYLKDIAKRTNSAMLKSASLHWRVDTVLSFGVCAGFLFGFILQVSGFNKITPYIDPVIAIILAVFLIQSPIKAISHSVLELLDAVPGEDIRSRVRKVVELYKPKSFGVHRLRTRKAGEKIFVDICFIVHGNLTVVEAEDLAKGFERDLKTHLSGCDVIVYFKPT